MKKTHEVWFCHIKLFQKEKKYALFKDSCLYGISNNGMQESDYSNSQDTAYILEKREIYTGQNITRKILGFCQCSDFYLFSSNLVFTIC